MKLLRRWFIRCFAAWPTLTFEEQQAIRETRSMFLHRFGV
jgi:hypothetical protein